MSDSNVEVLGMYTQKYYVHKYNFFDHEGHLFVLAFACIKNVYKLGFPDFLISKFLEYNGSLQGSWK